MISGCYLISGLLLAGTGYLFYLDVLNAVTQTAQWCVIFFASAAASAGYLTVTRYRTETPRRIPSSVTLARGSPRAKSLQLLPY